eukprot:symbB.v1.2.001893.t1/scaffold101.1/size361152/7
MNVLGHFEKRGLLSEETLEYLDADPFVLFGIDDPLTQQALAKLEKFPALLCDGAVPTLEEWAYYLRIQPDDKELAHLKHQLKTRWFNTEPSDGKLNVSVDCSGDVQRLGRI